MNETSDDLIEAFIEGLITDEQLEELSALLLKDPAYGEKLARASKNDLFLKQILAVESTKRSETPVKSHRHSKVLKRRRIAADQKPAEKVKEWGWPLILSLASCLICAIAIGFITQINQSEPEPNTQALTQSPVSGELRVEVLALKGDVSFTRNNIVKRMTKTTRLKVGDEILSRPKSIFKFKLANEKTIFHLDPSSNLVLKGKKGKTWHLKWGAVGASVVPQAEGERVKFSTRNANFEVIGTIFRIESDKNESKLEVSEGKVRMQRLKDKRSALVKAGMTLSTSNKGFKPLRIGIDDKTEMTVSRLSLINTDTQKPIPGYEDLKAGQVIKLSELPSNNLNIRIHTLPEKVGSLILNMTGPRGFRLKKLENFFPYSMKNLSTALSDTDPVNYMPYQFEEGDYVVQTTLFSQMDQMGRQTKTSELKFKVVK